MTWEAWYTSAGIATVLWAVGFLVWAVRPGLDPADTTGRVMGGIVAGLTAGIFLGYWVGTGIGIGIGA